MKYQKTSELYRAFKSGELSASKYELRISGDAVVLHDKKSRQDKPELFISVGHMSTIDDLLKLLELPASIEIT